MPAQTPSVAPQPATGNHSYDPPPAPQQLFGHSLIMREPIRDHHIEPATGPDSEHVIDEAIATLGTLRSLPWLGDWSNTAPPCQPHPPSRTATTRAVADARHQDYCWAEIADLLSVTRASAWERYAGRTTTNHTTTVLD